MPPVKTMTSASPASSASPAPAVSNPASTSPGPRGLLRLARRAAALEARILLGVLVAGMVAALAWFPLQIPFVAVVLLLACGRAWRLLLDDAEAGA